MTQQTTEALELFLTNKDARALILRGDWGVGKTHFWNDFASTSVTGETTEATSVCYSYVSLFGKSSLSSVEKAVMNGTTPLRDGDGSRKSTRDTVAAYTEKFKKLLPKEVKESAVSKAIWSRILDRKGEIELPVLGKVGDWFSAFDFVKNYLIVLDDLERRSKDLDLRDILGFIDNLAAQRSCKVVLICNENALNSEDQLVLNQYRDKIFDIEVSLLRSPREIAQIGVSKRTPFRDPAVDVLAQLQVSNIRVAKKLQALLDRVAPLVQDPNPQVVREICEHAALLVWGRFDSRSQIPFHEMRARATRESWVKISVAAMTARKGAVEVKREPWEVAWSDASSELHFHPMECDPVFLDYLEFGTFDSVAFTRFVAMRTANAHVAETKESLDAAWDLYANSLNPDASAFVSQMVAILSTERIFHLSAPEVDAALSVLEWIQVETEDFAKRYSESAGERLPSIRENQRRFGDRSMSTALTPYVERACAQADAFLPALTEAIQRTGSARGWNSADIAALNACTEEELIAWIASNPPSMATLIKNGLLFEGMSSGGDARIDAIRKKTIALLQALAGQSPLNKARVSKIYNIQIEEPQNDLQ